MVLTVLGKQNHSVAQVLRDPPAKANHCKDMTHMCLRPYKLEHENKVLHAHTCTQAIKHYYRKEMQKSEGTYFQPNWIKSVI